MHKCTCCSSDPTGPSSSWLGPQGALVFPVRSPGLQLLQYLALNPLIPLACLMFITSYTHWRMHPHNMHATVSPVAATPDTQIPVTLGPLSSCAPAFPAAGITEVWAPVTPGPLSSCWHLDVHPHRTDRPSPRKRLRNGVQ